MDDDLELLAQLGISLELNKAETHSAREERLIVGFEDIVTFFETHGRLPEHGEDRDIFERLYAVRLDRLRANPEFRDLLASHDPHGLLSQTLTSPPAAIDELDDDALLSELGINEADGRDISTLKHVKVRSEVRTAEEIANRKVCSDFATFQPLFAQVKQELKAGVRQTRRFARMAEIKQGEFFIVSGQIAYVVDVGAEFVSDYDRRDSRLRVIYDNGTESDVLLRSLQRALHKDDAGRRITAPSAGPLFEGDQDADGGYSESGTIYVVRSNSEHPEIASRRELIHKIGVTGGKVEARLATAATDSTFLLADVEIVATYKLYGFNRSKLENLIHRVFASARLNLSLPDRFGNPVEPQEWFLVPLHIIDQVIERIQDQTIVEFEYDVKTASLRKIE